MSYEHLVPSTKSALIELLFLEELSKLTKLPKSYAIDKVSIQASVAPLKTEIVPSKERMIVMSRAKNTAMEMRKK